MRDTEVGRVRLWGVRCFNVGVEVGLDCWGLLGLHVFCQAKKRENNWGTGEK
jgi:hypothetical protein